MYSDKLISALLFSKAPNLPGWSTDSSAAMFVELEGNWNLWKCFFQWERSTERKRSGLMGPGYLKHTHSFQSSTKVWSNRIQLRVTYSSLEPSSSLCAIPWSIQPAAAKCRHFALFDALVARCRVSPPNEVAPYKAARHLIASSNN